MCVVAIVGVCAFTREGFADALSGTRFDPSEVHHHVRVVLDRGHATLHVERVIFNPGAKSDQAVLSLDLPDGAVATSLKTLGSLNGKPHWFYGDLREAEEAAAAYKELTGIGGYYPKDPALLSWRSATDLLLQVFPCAPKQNKAVGYALEVPMRYEQGRYRLELPALGLEDQPATLTVETAHAGDKLFIDDKALDAGRILSASDFTNLALEPYRQFGIKGELAVADTGFGRTFAHVQFALAKELAQVPAGAYVVLAIDNSRSMGPDRQNAARMAAKTLKLFPNAQAQILDFTRKPNPRFFGFVPAQTALGSLQREITHVAVPEAGNGSEVDIALAEAERLLSAVPGTPAKRILLFTDGLAPWRITPDSVAASVGKSGAIVQIIHVAEDLPTSFQKNDDDAWAKAARLTGGLVWEPQNEPPDDENAPTPNPYLPLVRPTILYDAFYTFQASEEAEHIGDLVEGSGFERQGVFDGSVRWAQLSGELWAKPFRLTVQSDRQAGKLWSALVFGTQQLSELNEAEMMVLAKRGGAVSPVTSYLAIEPGVRPSTDGLALEEGSGGLGLSGTGEGGGGAGYGSGHGSIGGARAFDAQAFLQKQLAAKWEQCKGEAGKASVILETHYVEVADVVAKVEVQDPEKYECLSEAAWSLDLRDLPFKDLRQTWEIQL